MFAESVLTIIGLATAQVVALPPEHLTTSMWNQLPTAKYVDTSSAHVPVRKNSNDMGVQTNAKAALVMDVQSGSVLFESDAQEAYSIASLTKLMTAMVYLDQKPNLDSDTITILPEDNPEAVSLFASNEVLSARDALRALLIPSSNEAANALARSSLGKQAFIKAMNAKAAELGLQHANFVEPSGFDSNNRASAKDVAIMLRTAMTYPDILANANQDRAVLKGKSGRSYTLKTTNLLLSSFLNKAPYKVVAAKTGTLPEAGFCFAQVTKDQANHMVITIVLGSDTHLDRFQDAKALTFWAFQNFNWPATAAMADNQLASR